MIMSEIVAAMIEAGCEPKAAAMLMVAAFELGCNYRDASRDASRDGVTAVTVPKRTSGAIRSARYRQKHKQTQPPAKANDVAVAGVVGVTEGRDASRDGVTQRCDLSSFSSCESGLPERKKEVSQQVERRARGTRLERDASLSDADRHFAGSHGVADPDALWVEFVDFWIGVPGQRGIKLDWSATWRNRVRAVSTGAVGGKTRKRGSFLDLALQLEQTDHE